jgi:hypothetical protein
MKKFINVIALSILISSCATNSNQEQSASDSLQTVSTQALPSKSAPIEYAPTKYKSDEGKFAIYFPGEPTISHENIPTEAGNIQLHMYMYEQSATEVFLIGYCDYPSDAVKAGSTTDMLQGAKNGIVNNLRATITEENKITEQGSEGIEFKASGNGGIYLAYRVLLKGNRLYQIGILRDGSFPSNENIQLFIGSFELIS